MIPGETEQLLADRFDEEAYDNFLFFGSKAKRKARKAKRQEKRKIRRAKRANRPRKPFEETLVGQTIAGLGGAQGIAGAIDSLSGTSKRNPDLLQTEPGDYQVDMGSEASDQKKGIPVTVYVVGGMVLLGAVAFIVSKNTSK